MVINNKALEFSASAVLWPSSTKAEMLACLTALLVVPASANVSLYTDSAATIAGFDNIGSYRNLSVRKREKIPNFQIWLTIVHTIECKQLRIKMIKVKAHSGDRLNDRVDKLAKDATLSAPRLNVKYMCLPGLNLKLACANLTLDTSSRKSIKALLDTQCFSKLLQLQRNSDLQILTEHHHIN